MTRWTMFGGTPSSTSHVAYEFRGRGELLNQVREKLLPAWEGGASAEVAEAMAAFREEHDQHFVDQAKVPRSDVPAFRKWAADIATWLNSTEQSR